MLAPLRLREVHEQLTSQKTQAESACDFHHSDRLSSVGDLHRQLTAGLQPAGRQDVGAEAGVIMACVAIPRVARLIGEDPADHFPGTFGRTIAL